MINLPASGRSLLLIGLAAYILFAIVTFPASLAIAWFAPEEIQTSNISGSAWSGHADTIVTPGVTLVDTTWSFRPLSLLKARLAYRIDTKVGGGRVETHISFSPGGSILLSELSGVLPVSYFPPVAPSVDLDGQIGLNFAELLIEDQWPVDARGSVDVAGLRLVAPVAESLGSYEVVFDGAGESGLVGIISEVDGPLEVSGTLSLPDNRQWRAKGQARPNSAASTQLVQGLAFLGSRNPDGSYTLDYPAR